jgi:hypothetical protein
MKDHTEICKQIVDFLNYLGHFAWKNQTGIVRKGPSWIQYGYPGSSDVFCVMRGGKFLGVEVKVGKDVQREKQKLFEEILHKMGAQYIQARSLDDFKSKFVYDEHGGYKNDPKYRHEYDE